MHQLGLIHRCLIRPGQIRACPISKKIRIFQTMTRPGDVGTMKTEISDHAKLMPTTRSSYKSNEVPTDLGSGSGVPTTPGSTGVEWQVGVGSRRCVSAGQGLNSEKPDPSVIRSQRSDVAGGGLIRLRFIPAGMQQEEDLRGSSAVSVGCPKQWHSTEVSSGRYRKKSAR